MKLTYKGVTYRSAEHAYQHAMALFHACPISGRRILAARTAPQAKKIANSVPKCEKWHEKKTTVMADILLAKAKQCPKFKSALLETDQKTLVHNIDTDSFWGCGPDLMGKNMMGVLLEELRESLRNQPHEEPPPPPSTPTNQTPSPTDEAPTSSNTHQTEAEEAEVPKPKNDDTAKTDDSPDTPCPPTPEDPYVLVLGNSNARNMADLLKLHSAKSVVYPGGTMDYITSRVRYTGKETNPSHIILMAGDIETAEGMHPNGITTRFNKLVREVRRVYPWSRLILVGLTPTGNSKRQIAIRCLNSLMQHLANERMIAFVDNFNSRLRDSIHLSYVSKKVLSQKITQIIKKPHLDAIRRFR